MRKIAAAISVLSAGLFVGGYAQAFDFEYGEITGSLKSRISIGATIRTENQDKGLLGILNVDGQQATCDAGESNVAALGQTIAIADPLGGCALSNFGTFINSQGSFSGHGVDDGNLNYDQHEIVAATAKLVSDFQVGYKNFRFVSRVIATADPTAVGFEESHPNSFFTCDIDNDGVVTEEEQDGTVCGGQPKKTAREKDAEDQIGYRVDFEVAYLSMETEFFEQYQSWSIGKKIVRWGESLALPINSINTINPPSVVRLQTPGRGLDEIFDATNLFHFTTGITDTISMEAVYMLGWNPVELPPPGSFFSPADIVGGDGQGRQAATLGLGFSREDPSNLFDRPMNADIPSTEFGRDCFADRDGDGFSFDGTARDPYGDAGGSQPDAGFGDGQNGRLNQGGHRGQMELVETTVRNSDGSERTVSGLRPVGVDQEGALDFTGGRQACVAETKRADDNGQWGIQFKWFAENLGGSEIGFYYLNYHSRLPYISVYSAQLSNAAATLPDLPAIPGVPAPTAVLNTVTGIAAALKVADTLRLVQEFPEDIDMFGVSISTNIGDYSVAAEYSYRPSLPLQVNVPDLIFYGLAPAFQGTRCNAIASVIDQYRNGDYEEFASEGDCPLVSNAPGEYLQGYEEFPVGQGEVVVISLAETNPFWADTWIRILNVGFTKVYGLTNNPQELALAGAATQTGPLPGRAQRDPGFDGGGIDGATDEQNLLSIVILNPTQEDNDRFGTSFSWGYRFINILTYEQIFGGTVQLTGALFHDVNGNTPGPGTNFIEDRKTFVFGTQFQKGSWQFDGTYVWNTGADTFNAARDRDTFSAAVTYTF